MWSAYVQIHTFPRHPERHHRAHPDNRTVLVASPTEDSSAMLPGSQRSGGANTGGRRC